MQPRAWVPLGRLWRTETMDKVYSGSRAFSAIGCAVGIHDVQGIRPLPLRLDLRNHSPTGFEWGYGGSGPAQLALALLADVFDDVFALRHYQDFKWEVVAKLRYKGWTLRETEIRLCALVTTSARSRAEVRSML